MEVRIKQGEEMIDATIEMVDGVMVVSPKEVKFEPKDGDIIYTYAGFKWVSIYKSENHNVIFSYVDYEIDGNRIWISCSLCTKRGVKELRLATEEEKKLLFDRLAEEGLAWDADKKELVKLKWKPKDNELYCRPGFNNEEFACYKDRWNNVKYENFLYNKGWAFKTEQECQEFCNRLNEAINSVKP